MGQHASAILRIVLGLPPVMVGVALALNGPVVVVGQNQVTKWATGHMHTSAANASVLLYSVSCHAWRIGLGGSSGAAFALVILAIVIRTFGENFGRADHSVALQSFAPRDRLIRRCLRVVF